CSTKDARDRQPVSGSQDSGITEPDRLETKTIGYYRPYRPKFKKIKNRCIMGTLTGKWTFPNAMGEFK
ncbi:MAG: hypothetical protein ACLQVY_22025, partial [Limisphaerales bacterium]